MGKSQSREQVIIAQTGGKNEADTSMLHDLTHSKLDTLLLIVAVVLAIAFCFFAGRCFKRRYTELLRRELRGSRASRRVNSNPHAVPAYSVA